MKHYIEVLGCAVKDKVTGLEGVADSVCFDLYGCVQVGVTPFAKDGKIENSRWFDHKRLEVTSTERKLPIPNFELASAESVRQPRASIGDEQGAADKPERSTVKQ